MDRDRDQALLDYLLIDQDLCKKWARSLIRRKNKFLEWLQSHGYPTEPEEIPKIALREYHNYLTDQYAPSTIRKRMTSINHWLKFNDVYTAKNMTFRTPSQGRIDRPYYSQEQASMIWRASREMGPKYHCLVALNLGMGLRQIGTYRMAWRNIDLEDRRAKVIGKAKKSRSLIIPIRVVRALEIWREAQAQKWGPCKYVMTLKRSPERPRRVKTLGDWLNRILEEAGVPKLDGFRAGRRRFGRDLYIATNRDIVSVSQYLGHASTDQTKKYLELQEYDQRRAIEKLDKMAGPELTV